MKNLLLMLLIFVSFSTTAQFNKGRILVGGNVGWDSSLFFKVGLQVYLKD